MNYQNENRNVQALKEVADQMNEVRELAKRMTETVYREHQRRVAAENKVVALEEWKARKEQEEQRAYEAAVSLAQKADAGITVKEMAEELKKLGIDTGQQRLFAWLRDSGYVVRSEGGHNRPSPKSRELGFLTECEQSYQRANGKEDIGYSIRVTEKGQQYFKNLFAWYKEEMQARNKARQELQRLQKNEKQREYDRAKRAAKKRDSM